MGLAYVQAIQGPSLADGVVATAKHMVGHGLAEGGLNQAPVHAGRRELLDEQLAPFEAAVREGRIGSIMPAYCEVDGVPCHASDVPPRRHPAPPVGVRGDRRVRLHGGRDAVDRAPPHGRPRASPRGSRCGRAWTRSCRRPPPTGRRCSRRSRTGAWPRPTWTRSSSACCGSSSGSGCSSGRTSMRRRSRRSPRCWPTRRWRPGSWPSGRSCSSTTTACCRSPRTRGGSRCSGRIADSARDLIGDYGHLLHLETLNESLDRTDTFGFPLTDPARDPEPRRRPDDPDRAPGTVRGGAGGPRARHGTASRHGRGARGGRRRGFGGRRRDRRPRRAVRPDRRLDDRRVPRPQHARLPRPPAGAAGARGRDGHPGGARGGQRAAAGAHLGGRARRRDRPRVGARATPARTRWPPCSPAT